MISLPHKQNKRHSVDIFSNIMVFLFVIIAANTAVFVDNNLFLFSSFFLLLIVFIQRRLVLDKVVVIIFIAWGVVNLNSYFYNQTEFRIITFLGYFIKLLIPYLIIKIIGFDFFKKLEKTIFILAAISLPLFLLQGLFSPVFYALGESLNFITKLSQADRGEGFYLIFYMFNGWSPFRNSGFMWEPGAFALMLIIGFSLHLYLNSFKIDGKRAIVYLLALITTFSTMGYVVSLIIIGSVILQSRKFKYLALGLLLMPIAYYYLLNLDFVGKEIEHHYERAESQKIIYREHQEIAKFNRWGYIMSAFESSLGWPWGNGIFINKDIKQSFDIDITGPSTLGEILLMWGWIGVIFWFYSNFLFFRKWPGIKQRIIVDFLMALSIILAFSSNPLPKNPMFFTLILTPYINMLNSPIVNVKISRR